MEENNKTYYNYKIYCENVTTLAFDFEFENTLAERIAKFIDEYIETVETIENERIISENILSFENTLEQGLIKIIESLLIAYNEDDINTQDLMLALSY